MVNRLVQCLSTSYCKWVCSPKRWYGPMAWLIGQRQTRCQSCLTYLRRLSLWLQLLRNLLPLLHLHNPQLPRHSISNHSISNHSISNQLGINSRPRIYSRLFCMYFLACRH